MWIASVSPKYPYHQGIVVRNNAAVTSDINQSASSSWVTRFPQDQEAYFQYGATPGSKAGMGPAVRLQDATDLESDQYIVFFYQAGLHNKSTVRIWKRLNGVWTNPASSTVPKDLHKGDQIGIRAVGAKVSAYLNGQVVVSFVDPKPILKPGYIQLYVGDDVGHIADNFGGGAVPVQSAGTPEILTPAPNSTLPGSTVNFSWRANGQPVTHWYLSIGKTQGAWNIADLDQGTRLATTVTGLPTNGSAVWVRLWYRVNGNWLGRDYRYTAATAGGGTGTPALSTPTASVLPGTTVNFSWTANGNPVTRWYLQVGTSQGALDIANLSMDTKLSTTVSGLPRNGRPVWVRLWYLIDGVWRSRDRQYTAAS
jgi:hypothetical protein